MTSRVARHLRSLCWFSAHKGQHCVALQKEQCRMIYSDIRASPGVISHRVVIPSIIKPSFKEHSLMRPGTTPFIPSTLTLASETRYRDTEYVCPSQLHSKFPQLVILDNLTSVKSFYDCPVTSSIVSSIIAPQTVKNPVEISDPSRGVEQAPAKEAKIIMRIRHKKMKKHKLRKLRKRMYFVWKKQKMARRKKRETIFRKELTDIKSAGENFNAEAFVKEQLQKARRGGYYINVFESKL